jgi:hypothetical protein
VALLVIILGIGSLTHHFWPINETVPFDTIPAVAGAIVVLFASYKHLKLADFFQLFVVGVAGLAALLIDTEACKFLPFGTHFIWHFLAAYSLYLLGRRVV